MCSVAVDLDVVAFGCMVGGAQEARRTIDEFLRFPHNPPASHADTAVGEHKQYLMAQSEDYRASVESGSILAKS